MRVKQLIQIGLLAVMFAWCTGKTEGKLRGSAHDFSGDTWNPSGEICLPCHTPHGGDLSVTDAPLWNHTVTQATFQLYQSSTMQATDLGQPSGRSKLCLSCHDGTVALDSFGDTVGSRYIGAEGNIGTDLRNDHPISFTYNDALAVADRGLYPPSSRASGLGSTIQRDMLFNNKMECSSCHDVHNEAGIDDLLRKSNAGSALCLTCHDK